MKVPKASKKAGKADEAGEALKAKPAKVRRLEREQRTREREDVFSSSQYFLLLVTQVFPHLFFFLSLPPHKQVHTKAAGEALKIVKVPKAPKVSLQFR